MSQNNEDNPQDSPNPANLAIEYSPSEEPPRRQPRQPGNLQDLLRYAVEAGSRAGGDVNPTRGPMDEVSRGFLLNALNSMMVNVAEELATIIRTLKDNQHQKDVCVDALDNLSDYVCSIDSANDFLKMGGLPVVRNLLEGADDELRWKAAETIASIVQNNPFSQKFVIESDTLQLLLSCIENDPSVIVRVKSLYAVSCLVRDNEECLKEFTKKDGFSVLLRCMQSKEEKLVIKSCFLISCLCTDNDAVKDVLVSMGIVEQMCLLIDIDKAFDSEMNEHLVSALSSLSRQSPHVQMLCRQEQLNLKFKLNYIKEKHGGNEVYFKEMEFVNALLRTVFESNAADDDYEDR